MSRRVSLICSRLTWQLINCYLSLLQAHRQGKLRQSMFCSVFAILNKRTTYFLEHPEREVNILIGGDKGGSYTKFHFEIVAPGIVSSAYVHIFAMFEVLDSRQIMLKVLEPFQGQIKNMQHKDFVLSGGFKVKLFLNGDFKMLDLVMGHQTSALIQALRIWSHQVI